MRVNDNKSIQMLLHYSNEFDNINVIINDLKLLKYKTIKEKIIKADKIITWLQTITNFDEHKNLLSNIATIFVHRRLLDQLL